MKYATNASPIEHLLQKIEDLLTEHNCRLHIIRGTFYLEHNGVEHYIADKEDGTSTTLLPRQLDSEKLILVEP